MGSWKPLFLLAPWALLVATLLVLRLESPRLGRYILVSHVTDLAAGLVVALLAWMILHRWFSPWGAYCALILPAVFGGGFPDYSHGAGFVLEHFTLGGIGQKTLAYKLFHKNLLPNLIVMPLAILLGLLFLWAAKKLGANPRVPRAWPVAATALALAGAILHIYVLDPMDY